MDGFAQAAFIEVMAANLVGEGVKLRDGVGRKDVLPAPFAVGVGIFALQGVGQVDVAVAIGQVFKVQSSGALQLVLPERLPRRVSGKMVTRSLSPCRPGR